MSDALGWLDCPECRRSVLGPDRIEHADGCTNWHAESARRLARHGEGAIIPCPACRSELYDRVVWDEGQQLPICPDCGADVSAGDVDRVRAAISALLDKASDPITVDPRGMQDRYVLVPWYLIEDLRKALGPVAPETAGPAHDGAEGAGS